MEQWESTFHNNILSCECNCSNCNSTYPSTHSLSIHLQTVSGSCSCLLLTTHTAIVYTIVQAHLDYSKLQCKCNGYEKVVIIIEGGYVRNCLYLQINLLHQIRHRINTRVVFWNTQSIQQRMARVNCSPILITTTAAPQKWTEEKLNVSHIRRII